MSPIAACRPKTRSLQQIQHLYYFIKNLKNVVAKMHFSKQKQYLKEVIISQANYLAITAHAVLWTIGSSLSSLTKQNDSPPTPLKIQSACPTYIFNTWSKFS